jgi:hypothetical protein
MPLSASQIIEKIEIEIGGCRVEDILFLENNVCVSSVRHHVTINQYQDHYNHYNCDHVVIEETTTTIKVDVSSHDEIIVPLPLLALKLNEYELFLAPDSIYETRLIIHFKNYYCITSTTVLLHSLP